MKTKTSELTGVALDWAVALCECYTDLRVNSYRLRPEPIMTPPRKENAPAHLFELTFSTDWAQGGPIIEREKIDLTWDVTLRHKDGGWTAIGQDPTDLDAPLCQEDGPTPLVAAMRCYVASRLGDEIDVPEELK